MIDQSLAGEINKKIIKNINVKVTMALRYGYLHPTRHLNRKITLLR